jgi:hypothetical protein
LLTFLANIATSELLQREYRTWVKIAVTLFLLTVLYAIGRLLGYVLRRVSGKRRWSRPMASADVIPSDVTNQTSARRASLHVTRRASAAQAIEALQQVTEAVALSEAKGNANVESGAHFASENEYWESSDTSEYISSSFAESDSSHSVPSECIDSEAKASSIISMSDEDVVFTSDSSGASDSSMQFTSSGSSRQ